MSEGTVVRLRHDTPTLLTKRQLAARLGRSERWVELQARDHGLPVLEEPDGFGRRLYDLAAVEAWREIPKPVRVSLEQRVAALERVVNGLLRSA